MTRRSHITENTKKQPVSPAPAGEMFQSRPFMVQQQTEESQQPDLKTALQRAERYGHRLDRIASIKPPVQAKLKIGQPGDRHEQEADRVAARVVNQIHAPTAQRQEMPEEDELQMKPEIGTIQRETMPDEDEELQTKPTGGGMAATPDLEAPIQQARGSGQPLADSIKEPMEQAFGADFSGVKVHTNAQSDQLNRSIQARAFTTGQDVFFRQGEYNPGSRGGQELIAHELTHVVQQSGAAISSEEKRDNKFINLVENTGHERVSPKNGKGSDISEKAKGDDYANNVPKLIREMDSKTFEGSFIDNAIENCIKIIEDKRPQCAFFGSLTGEDTNQNTYSSYCLRLGAAMENLQRLLKDGDRKQLKSDGFLQEALCNRIISELPTQAIDQRVKSAHKDRKDIDKKRKDQIKSSMDEIDVQLSMLATAMKNRIKTLLDEKIAEHQKK